MHLEKELVRSSAVLSTTIPEWREPRVHATAKAHFCLRSCVKLPGAIDASSLLVGDVCHRAPSDQVAFRVRDTDNGPDHC